MSGCRRLGLTTLPFVSREQALRLLCALCFGQLEKRTKQNKNDRPPSRFGKMGAPRVLGDQMPGSGVPGRITRTDPHRVPSPRARAGALGEARAQGGRLQLQAAGIRICSCPLGGGGQDSSNPAQIQPRGPCDGPIPRKPRPKTGRRGHIWGCLAPPPLYILQTVLAPGTCTQLPIWAFDGVGFILALIPHSCAALTSYSAPWRPGALICKTRKGRVWWENVCEPFAQCPASADGGGCRRRWLPSPGVTWEDQGLWPGKGPLSGSGAPGRARARRCPC